jgi:hypothetical protein
LQKKIGEQMFIYDHSSGSVLELDAVLKGLDVSKMVLYELLFIVDGSYPAPQKIFQPA